MHARGMTQDQSRQMFIRECYQDEGNARQQSARGTYDPAYLNYTMGKLMIRKLRDDYCAAHPDLVKDGDLVFIFSDEGADSAEAPEKTIGI
jgi:hypothetical protein